MLNQIREGRTDLVIEYVAAGHAPGSRDDGGVSLIQWCAYYGDVSAIRFLVSRGGALTELGDNLDLNGAAFHGHWELCQFLIEKGANVNHPLPDTGETPLHAATSKISSPDYEQVLRILLTNGADPNRATQPGVPTGSFMRDCRTVGETPLHRAAAFGNERVIRMLLDSGAKKEVKDAHGDSPLSWASWHLRPAYILQMLCYGSFAIHPDAVTLSRQSR